MIIIIKNFSLDNDRELKLRALENILCAYGEGRHIVWMPIEIAKKIKLIEGLSSFAKRVAIELEESVIETRRIEDYFDFHVECDFEDKHIFEHKDKITKLGYHHLSNSETLQSPALLTENLLDANALIIAAQSYLCANKSISMLSIKLQSTAGGGSTTYNVFCQKNDQKKLLACFIDSDKKHPLGSYGDTAKRFSGTPKGYNINYYLEILPTQEIENIIPNRILKEIFPVSENGIIFNRNMEKAYRAFPDHKIGLKVSTAIELDRKHQADFWKEFYSEHGDSWICPPFGERLLETSVNHLNSMSSHKISESLDSDIDAEWIRISKIVASWGVGRRRQTV